MGTPGSWPGASAASAPTTATHSFRLGPDKTWRNILHARFSPPYNRSSDTAGCGNAKYMGSSIPDRKISETFLDFASPLLRDLPSEALEHRAREALQVSFTAWNAVIFADVLNDHRHLDEIQRLTAGKPETALLMERMIARKRSLFANDARLIGTWEVTRTTMASMSAPTRETHTPCDRTVGINNRRSGLLQVVGFLFLTGSAEGNT